jgi:hypothetical protein
MGKPQRRFGKEFEGEAVWLVEVSGRTRRSHDNGARAVWVGRGGKSRIASGGLAGRKLLPVERA